MAALSIKLSTPVLKFQSPKYRKQVSNPGSSCIVRISNDGKTVMKSAMEFHVDGCDEQTANEYREFSNDSQLMLEREKEIYQHLGPHRDVLAYLEITEAGIVFPYLRNGDLRSYLKCHTDPIPHALKLDWIKAALRSLDFAHSAEVLPCDVSARNFLVADDLSIVLCDFAGARIGDKPNMVRPETRYEKFQGQQPLPISIATEIFAIGSLIYEISTEKRPYDEKEDEQVETLFRDQEFPATDDVPFGSIVKACWLGEFKSAAEVLQAVVSTDIGI